MRIPAILTFLFFLTLCLYKSSVWAETLPLPEIQSDKTTSNVNDPGNDAIDGKKELKPVDAELETTLAKDTNKLSENKPTETISNDKNTIDTANEGEESEQPEAEAEIPSVKDPIQPYNRAIFVFNDKAYYYFIKPIYKGYSKVVPEKARISVRNFFTNVKMPVRFFNCLFQAKFKGAGTEMLRFVINSTVGIAGFFDPAKSKFHLERQDRDFGQTLGKGKMGSGFYIVWPFIGPSTARDTLGYAGDIALSPLTWVSYFFLRPLEGFGSGAGDNVNDVSIDKGETYESITKQAIDPYIALQDAYIQNRIKKIKE